MNFYINKTSSWKELLIWQATAKNRDITGSVTLREKCPNTEFFSGPYFFVFGPEKTPYLDTFDEV